MTIPHPSEKYKFESNMLSYVMERNKHNGTENVSDNYHLRSCYGNDAYYKIRLVQCFIHEEEFDENFLNEDYTEVDTLLFETQKNQTYNGCQYLYDDQTIDINLSPESTKEDTYPTIQGIVEYSFGIAKMFKTPFKIQFLIPKVSPDPSGYPQIVMVPNVAHEFKINANGIGFIKNEDEHKLELATEAGLFVHEAKNFERELNDAIWHARALMKNNIS